MILLIITKVLDDYNHFKQHKFSSVTLYLFYSALIRLGTSASEVTTVWHYRNFMMMMMVTMMIIIINDYPFSALTLLVG